MNRETVNMVRSPISVEGNIRLVPYYPAYDTALAWYQDAQLCKQVDNRDFVYDLPLLKRMYHYLDTHGELFYIEYRGVLCGDVSLRTTGELAIVICKEYQNKHIGRKVIEKMLELARERGLAECFAHIYSFNTQSQKMFESVGFVPQDEEHYIYKLQKGEPTMTKLTLEEKQELIRMALAARERAYTPYSDFMVGAALRAEDGRIFTGCNVENAAFTPTSCAERTALFKAVAEGVTRFTDIAVVGARRGEVNKQITSPCGVCRQALFEFGGPELNVIMAKSPDDFIERSMDELLPFGFGPSNVAGNKAVEDVSFQIRKGEAFGLVGESGCGKTTVGKMLVNLLKPTSGKIVFDGKELTAMKPAERKQYCKDIQLIFQDPYASLNPRMRIGDIIAEPIITNNILPKDQVEDRVNELLERVGLANYMRNRYPHEFSGGQRQRVGIARALAVNPKLIVCDEPVSALDVSIQAQVLNLLDELDRKSVVRERVSSPV